MDGPQRRKQVKLTVFENEPLARLAEQRLWNENIPCVVRSLGVGAGGWGVATNLPHAIYVKDADHIRACDVLELAPAEIVEREDIFPVASSRPSGTLVILIMIAAAVLIFGVAERFIHRLIG